jgi:hypothetical protein
MKASHSRSHSPPNPPWKELGGSSDQAGGFALVFYSDNLSRLPVRFVTKPGDNKAYPNLETLTFGLFSTCNRSLRSSAVARRYPYLFFITNRGGTRVLSGYYHVRWYTEGVFRGMKDFALAADEAGFLDPPIDVSDVDRRCGTRLRKWFRSYRLLSPEECARILKLIQRRPDATETYLSEIDRLEHLNLRYGGSRYVSWKQTDKFSWELARGYLKTMSASGKKDRVLNASPTDTWKCQSCGSTIRNKALLKRCPDCGELGSLRAVKG